MTRADQKASILLAAAGVAIGAIIGGMASAAWSPLDYAMPWIAMWWLGSALVLGGVLTLAVTIYPRTRADPADNVADHLFYFDNAARLESPAQIGEALTSAAGDPLKRVSHQLFHISRVVARKYRLIRLAMWLLGIGAVVIIVAVVQPVW